MYERLLIMRAYGFFWVQIYVLKYTSICFAFSFFLKKHKQYLEISLFS